MDSLVSPTSKSAKLQADYFLKVLIVDDHEVFRNGLRDLLNDIDGFQVVAEASNCKDALAQIEAKSVDLVLFDLYLPDVEGIDTIRQVRKVIPQLRVILLSAIMDDELLLESVLAGVSGYLTKDTPAVDIVKALKGFQQGELAMLPAVSTRVVELLLQKYCALETALNKYQQNEIKVLDRVASEVPTSNILPPTSPPHVPLPILTPQEEKVYQLIRRGNSNKQIASQLFISRFTVGKHVQNILRKLGVANRTQAVSYNSFEGVK
jgi:DNA-binding NarL/FixJ family response regulator